MLNEEKWDFACYADLAAQVRGVAAQLRALGLPDRGTVALPTSPPFDFLVSLFGAWYAGGTALPIPPREAVRGEYDRYLTEILRTAHCELIAVSDDSAEADLQTATAGPKGTAQLHKLERASVHQLPPSPLNDAVLVQCTSGSTAGPRGVELTERNLLSNIEIIFEWLCWQETDSVAIWLPLHHDMGLIGMALTSICAQTDLRLMRPREFLAAPARWLECFGELDATITAAPNFGYEYALRTPSQVLARMDFSQWRIAVVGAERVLPGTLARFARKMRPHGFSAATLRPAYGLAEATLAVTGAGLGQPPRILKLDERRARGVLGSRVGVEAVKVLSASDEVEAGWLTSCGKPLGPMKVAIADESGATLGEGRLGEITVEGPSIARRYRGDTSAQSSTSLRGQRLYTGDVGFMHAGELYLVGRLADSFKVRAARVYAEDLEAQIANLLELPMGKCVVVPVGQFDDADGISAVIEAPAGTWIWSVVALLRRHLSPAILLSVYCSDRGAIPRTTSGKPRRHELWQQLRRGHPSHKLAYSSEAPVADLNETVDLS